ncbi:hypothetical protein KQX62_12010 [Rhodopseudomonas palustris]|uniref:Relaxosome protein TraY n=1 Tax=Rhodopseudomonas palustris TaxID=1076 RepID=A0AAX3DRK2_RHOPL|nr:hypothetical protein [Rhodopseudomonas palustris]UYO37483.1 hypothetical protein KQX62_12010 [Rhodopseudomonas palustris]
MPPRAKKTRKAASQGGKRYPLNMRTTFEVRQQLENAARNSGRSLTQEAEYRIDRTFQTERLLSDVLSLAYGPRLAGLLLAIGDAAKDTVVSISLNKLDDVTGMKWVDDPSAYDQVAKAVSEIVEAFRPEGEIPEPGAIPAPPEGMDAAFGKIIWMHNNGIMGVASAQGRLARLRGTLDVEDDGRLEEQRKLLGHLVQRIKD